VVADQELLDDATIEARETRDLGVLLCESGKEQHEVHRNTKRAATIYVGRRLSRQPHPLSTTRAERPSIPELVWINPPELGVAAIN
jgi:hypothetical protein